MTSKTPTSQPKTPTRATDTTLRIVPIGSSPYCPHFVDGQGRYGLKGYPLAHAMKHQPLRKNFEVLLSDAIGKDKSMKYFCPGFVKMSEDQRIQFWVWTLAAISKVESDCGTDKKALAEHKDGRSYVIGETQLEADIQQRRRIS